MRVLCVLIIASMLSAQALIMPISKPDGSLDISSLLSHISLLEQTIENKASQSDISKLEQTVRNMASQSDISKLEQTVQNMASQSDITKLESELQTARMEQKVTQTKLDTALDELKDLSNVKTELAVLQNQIQSGNSQCTCGSSGNLGGQPAQDLSGLQTDVSTLKSEVNQLQFLTNQTDVTSLYFDVSSIKTEIFKLKALHNRTGDPQSTQQGRSVYTIWGRTSCPPGNSVVYKGYTAGSYYNAKGGSAASLCLPEHPIYSNHTFGVHKDDVSLIYGTEYGADYTDMPLRSVDNEDMPCVVCESNRETSIMVPARNECYQGWTREYAGYLMAGRGDLSPADYICVNADAEATPGGHEVKGGRWMFPVESTCGSLVCPPYENGKTVTCVVCSK